MKIFLCLVMIGFVKLQGSEEQEHDPSGDDLEPTSRLRGGGPGTGTTKDWSHCSKDALCGHGRGDCDGNHQCEADHHCGNDNCRKFDTNAHRLADCCEKQNCKIWSGDYIEESTEPNINACANWCAGIEGCEIWTYYAETKKCWIKSAEVQVTCDDGSCDEEAWVTGTKGCGISEDEEGG